MRRELSVAFSRRAQPIWFRAAKWIVILAVARRFRRAPAFRGWVLRACAAALATHFFVRWKTRGWTQAWGGWNDPAFVIADPADASGL